MKRKLPAPSAASVIEGIYKREITADELLYTLEHNDLDWTYEHESFYSRPSLLNTIANYPNLCTTAVVKYILDKVPDDIVALRSPILNRTALHEAAIRGNFNMVSALLERSSSTDFVEIRDLSNYTAMEYAVVCRRSDTLQVFLRHGLMSDWVYATAMEHGDSDLNMLKLLVQAAIPTREDLLKVKTNIKHKIRHARSDDDIKHYEKAMQYLISAMETQERYNNELQPLLLRTTNLIRDLVGISIQYLTA